MSDQVITVRCGIFFSDGRWVPGGPDILLKANTAIDGFSGKDGYGPAELGGAG
jgi:hypothetical protein